MTASTDTTQSAPKRTPRRGAWLAAALAALGLAAAGSYAWWSGSQTRELARQARAAVLERKFNDARRLVTRWSDRAPRDGEPYYWLARLDVATDRPQPALDAMQQAIDRGYDREPLNVLRAVLLARGGQYEEAEPILRRALQNARGPEPEVAEALTRAYLATFRLGAAAASIERWMKDAPDDARPYLWRVEIDQRTDVETAVMVQNYRKALQLDPNLDKARLGLADKLRELQRNDEAEAEYEQYLARNPRSVEGHVGAGQTALQKSDIPGAVKHFTEALALNPKETIALKELALIEMRHGAYPRARDRFKAAVDVDPYDPEVRYNYARALRMCGDEKEAAEQTRATERLRKEHAQMIELRKALVEKPNDVSLRLEAARWLLAHGHDQEGLEWAELILKQTPNHPPTCRVLADYHQARGNTGLANYYRTAAGAAGAK